MLRLITDIPGYRASHYPAKARITSWEGNRSNTVDHRGFVDLITRYGASFKNLGLAAGNHVCVLMLGGDTELMAAEFALLKLGCVIIPLHVALPVEDMQNIIQEVHPVCCIARTSDELRVLEQIYPPTNLFALDSLHTPPLELIEPSQSNADPKDIALIMYTSGSTGLAKGVMLSHENIVSTVLSVLAVIPVQYGHTVMSYLPASHILERIAIYCYLATGAHLHFAENPRQGMALLKKVRPHYMTAVPRILDRAVHLFYRAGDTRHYLIRSLMHWALNTGTRTQGVIRRVSRKLILRRLRRSYGGRLRGILVGAAALSPNTGRIFQAAGIALREGYGLTECCGAATFNRFDPGGNMPGTVGIPVPGVQVRIDEQYGEVLIKGAGVTRGYFAKPSETALLFTEDGWLKTGDKGELVNDRFLKIVGRIKEQFKNAYGEYVSPLKLEQLLEEDPWVERALVVGSGKPESGALIIPDFELIEEWCRSKNVHWTAPMYMVHNTEVLQEFSNHISKINKSFAAHEQIQKFKLLHDPWSVENGMLTPSMKLRREVIESRFEKTINELYQ